MRRHPAFIPSPILRRLNFIMLFACLWAALTTQGAGQSATSTTNGGTPPGVAPGAPAGSYPLSGFENINMYNGHLSLSMPLYRLGGRGEAGYTPTLSINPYSWIVSSQLEPVSGGHYWMHYASANWWDGGTKPGYGPGVMLMRQSGSDPFYDAGTGNYYYSSTMSRMTFTMGDGTEYEFIDKATLGQVGYPPLNLPSRGSVWITHDGGVSATFIADGEYGDVTVAGTLTVWGPDGDLFLKNGSRYRIETGLVKWMRDRSGNRIDFSYDGNKRVISATDSLKRVITFAYSVNAGSPYGICDTITYTGFGGGSRTIRISRTNLGNCLRAGYSVQNISQLFPELDGGTVHNPNNTVSALWLPDGRSYQFRYNS